MKHDQAIEWLHEAARYFDKRSNDGEDLAYWANSANAENARKIADFLESIPSRAACAALADILFRHEINSLDGVAVATTLRGWSTGAAHVKESLTTAEKDSVETKIARAMLRRTIEKYSTVDGLCEALAEHPERTLSFLSGVALEVVSNSFKSA